MQSKEFETIATGSCKGAILGMKIYCINGISFVSLKCFVGVPVASESKIVPGEGSLARTKQLLTRYLFVQHIEWQLDLQ